MWSLDYRLLREPAEIRPGKQVVEILPDAEQTAAFWREWEKP
jgi:hypothetical protein